MEEITKEEDLPAILRIHGDNIDQVNFQTNVVGTTFSKNGSDVLSFLKSKVPVSDIKIKLVHEKENEYDPKAVAVGVSVRGAKKYIKIGYVPRDRNTVLCYAIDHPETYQVVVRDVSLFGGDELRPNIGLFFRYNILKVF